MAVKPEGARTAGVGNGAGGGATSRLRGRSRVAVVAAVALALGSSACMATSPAREPRLACHLAAEPPLVAGGPVRVRLTLVNEGSESLHALVWNTPFEGGWLGTPFAVSRDGVALEYGGAMVKRAEPEADEYLAFAPGEAHEAEADLAEAYAMTAPGEYQVRVTGSLADLAPAGAAPRPRSEHRPAALDCAPLALELAGP